MKRLILSLVLIVSLLVGCGVQNSEYKPTASKGIWVSYSEINTMLTSEKGFKEEFETLIKNCKTLKIEELYIHVRAFCDSLYPSKYFPLKPEASAYDFDILQYIIEKCHAENLKVHAWINPYRVSNTFSDITLLSEESPAYKWANSQNNNVVIHNGIYLNPTESDVQELVINGVPGKRMLLEIFCVLPKIVCSTSRTFACLEKIAMITTESTRCENIS